MGTRGLYHRVKRNGLRILRNTSAVAERHRGTSLVYDYGAGRLAGRPDALPGLLLQTDRAWYFAAKATDHDVRYRFEHRLIADLQYVRGRRVSVILVEVLPSKKQIEIGLSGSAIFECAFGGEDHEQSALMTSQAIAHDAGLVDSQGSPTARWRQRAAARSLEMENATSVVRTTLGRHGELP